MKNVIFIVSLLLIVLCNACDILQKDKEEEPKLTTVGFQGTLPDNLSLKTASQVTNGTTALSSTQDGSFVWHVLSIYDTSSKVRIEVELPWIKFSNNYVKMDTITSQQLAKKYYPYSLVREKLNNGEKLITSDKNTNATQTFRVGVYDQKNWKGYTSEQTLNQTDSYIKVIDIQEGVSTDAVLGNVKTIEVTFDLNVKLYKFDTSVAYAGNIKGQVKLRYKEKI
jgi:hypothetical protein